MMSLPKAAPWFLIAALVIVADRLTKWAALAWLRPGEALEVTGFFNLVLVFNRGAAFSFLANAPGWQTPFFVAVALIASAIVSWMLWRDPARRLLTYVNAGYVPPFLLRAGGGEERLRTGGPVIGLLEELELEPGVVELRPGDLMAVVTDGATEALAPSGEELGEARVGAALLAARGSAGEALRSLVAAVDEWTGPAGCSDDLTVLTLRAT